MHYFVFSIALLSFRDTKQLRSSTDTCGLVQRFSLYHWFFATLISDNRNKVPILWLFYNNIWLFLRRIWMPSFAMFSHEMIPMMAWYLTRIRSKHSASCPAIPSRTAAMNADRPSPVVSVHIAISPKCEDMRNLSKIRHIQVRIPRVATPILRFLQAQTPFNAQSAHSAASRCGAS